MGEAPHLESSERPDVAGGDDQRPGLTREAERVQRTAYPTTNGTAIMALVATLVPLPLAGGILGIVLGIFGLREIHRHGQTGAAVAVAAITFGSIQLALLLVSPILLNYLGVRMFGIRV